MARTVGAQAYLLGKHKVRQRHAARQNLRPLPLHIVLNLRPQTKLEWLEMSDPMPPLGEVAHFNYLALKAKHAFVQSSTQCVGNVCRHSQASVWYRMKGLQANAPVRGPWM